MYKPQGYTDVSPYMMVADVELTLRFVETVLKGERLRVFHHGDGKVMHAEARIGDSIIMMGEVAGEPPAHLHVYLEDVEAVFRRALDFGAELVQELALRDDGDRRGGALRRYIGQKLRPLTTGSEQTQDALRTNIARALNTSMDPHKGRWRHYALDTERWRQRRTYPRGPDSA